MNSISVWAEWSWLLCGHVWTPLGAGLLFFFKRPVDLHAHCSLAIAQLYLKCIHTYKHFEFEFVYHIAKNSTVVDDSHMFLHPYYSLLHP